MAENSSGNSAQKGPATIVGTLVKLLLKMITWAAISLVISIFIEWFGMTMIWEDQGVEHSAAMVQTEYGYLAESARRMPLLRDAETYQNTALKYAELTSYWMGLNWLRDISNGDNQAYFENSFLGLEFFRETVNWFSGINNYVIAAVNIVYVFILRVFVLTLALPAFWIFGSVGVARGLVGRELRKWCGGRESSGLYHLYLAALPNVTVGLWVVYLALPWSVNPLFIIAPIVVLFSLVISQLCLRFKKYL